MTEKTSWTEPRRLMIRRVFMGIQSRRYGVLTGVTGADRPVRKRVRKSRREWSRQAIDSSRASGVIPASSSFLPFDPCLAHIDQADKPSAPESAVPMEMVALPFGVTRTPETVNRKPWARSRIAADCALFAALTCWRDGA